MDNKDFQLKYIFNQKIEENTLYFYHKKYQILYEDYELEKMKKEINQKGCREY